MGHTAWKQLLGNADPIGKTLRLGKLSLKVIGTLREKGQSNFGNDQDDIVIIPLRTLQRRMKGNNDVQTIIVSVTDGVSTGIVKAGIEQLMRERRGIKADQEDDFHVRDMKELIDTLTGTTTVLTALEGDVLMQFLVEAVVLAAFGGLIGIALGVGAAGIGSRLMGVPFVFRTGIVAAAFLFSGAVGVVFGYVPAKKAARRDPIVALRHE